MQLRYTQLPKNITNMLQGSNVTINNRNEMLLMLQPSRIPNAHGPPAFEILEF